MTLEEIARTTAEPAIALSCLERAAELAPSISEDGGKARILAALFAGSEFLSAWLLARPEELAWLVEEDRLTAPRSAEAMSAGLDRLLLENNPMSALRRFRSRELCRVCARELSGAAGLEETLREWSNVADIAIDAALRHAEKEALAAHGSPVYTTLEGSEEKVAGICVLALGKLGGQELNISSDVDLMFVHSSDNGVTSGAQDGSGSVSLHEFFVRIARDTSRLLNEHTEDGIVFRVDLDLRPEGKKGEITNSVGAMEIYYESWGQQWERQALIKARRCGGDMAVADEVFDRLRPFVYRKYFDQRAIDEIAAMKVKIDQTLNTRKGAARAARDIKLGTGGIREIEFIAQALQLLYGARYPETRVKPTIRALDACFSLGLLSRPHYNDLKESYIFFRRLENRLQYHQLLQTHSLPADEGRLAAFGRLMGHEGEDPAGWLTDEVSSRRKRVRAIFDMFFARGKEKPAETFPVPLEDEKATAQWLDSMRFDQPEATARALNVLRNGRAFTHPSDRSRRAFDQFGPYLVTEAAEAPWSDKVILGFEQFVEARGKGGRSMLYELLNSHRPVIKLLAAIFSSSERLTATLLKQPDIFDRLLAAAPVGNPAERGLYRREFETVIDSGKSVEGKMTAMNSFRAAERLRLGVRRLLDLADRFELMEGLTILAEEYLRAVTRLAEDEASRSTERPADARWSILAAGKLGRREMNFGSDADILVFYEGDEQAKAYVTSLTQNMIRLSGTITPYGAGYLVDMRLRPDGENGPLAPSLGSMSEYYKNRAKAWERLALVGARPIMGDEGLNTRVMEVLRSFISAAPFTPKEAAGIASIRERIASEKVKHGAVDIKFGRGGLIEIEFVCQWLHIEHGLASCPDDAEGPLTASTLRKARREKWLKKEEADRLEAAYNFYRAVEDALRMDSEQSVSVIPPDGIALRRVARSVAAAGAGPDRFVDVAKETMEKVRAVYLDFIKARTGDETLAVE